MTSRSSAPFGLFVLLLATTACGVERATTPEDNEALGAVLSHGAPTAISAVPQSDVSIQFSWEDNSRHESGYEIYRADGAAGSFGPTPAATVVANTASYSDGSLSPLTEYCYKVRAFRTRGNRTAYSDFSDTKCATTFAPLPAPSGAKALPGLSGGVEILWTDNSTTEDGFHIYRTTTIGTTILTAGSNSTSYTEWGVPVEQELCYKVTAYISWGESDASNKDCIALPAAPANLSSAGVTSTTINLLWYDASSVESGFEVQAMLCYWSYGYEGWGYPTYVCDFSHVVKVLGPNDDDVGSYTVTELSPSQTYSFQVVAFKEKEDRKWLSGPTLVLDVTTATAP